MSLLFNLFLAAAIVAVVTASCPVCSCKSAPPVDKDLKDKSLSYPFFTIGYVDAIGSSVVDCAVALECDYSNAGTADPGKAIISGGKAVNDLIDNSLAGITCVESKWMFDGQEVESVGCITTAFENVDDGEVP